MLDGWSHFVAEGYDMDPADDLPVPRNEHRFAERISFDQVASRRTGQDLGCKAECNPSRTR
jgi:hypothetical protein